jgi:single-strand DNA-binding protein
MLGRQSRIRISKSELSASLAYIIQAEFLHCRWVTIKAEDIMAGVNKVILIGNLGKDPELRYTAAGQPVASFSVATTERWTDKNGQRQERTEWHNIVVWGKLAELTNQYLKKGRPVYIEGRITSRSWDDRDGNKKYRTEIVANQIQFLGSGPGPGSGADAPTQPEPQQSVEPHFDQNPPAAGQPGVPEDDLPF